MEFDFSDLTHFTIDHLEKSMRIQGWKQEGETYKSYTMFTKRIDLVDGKLQWQGCSIDGPPTVPYGDETWL